MLFYEQQYLLDIHWYHSYDIMTIKFVSIF